MNKLLHGIPISSDLVTQTLAVLGRKGSGKSYAAGKIAEVLMDAKIQVIVLDPIGNWYGLRLDKTGKHPSRFTIPVIGGTHGDIPIEPAAGNVLAKFLVDSGSSAVIDVSSFRKNDRKRFVTDFAEEFFHRKKTNKSPVHLIIEEAHIFAPEQGKGQEQMLGAIEDIVRIGRNFGIGCTMISQRPQSVNKEILNQAEPLIVFQLVAHHEREAVRKWMQHVGAENLKLLEELPSLHTGECFVWSPAWLRVFKKSKFYEKDTCDSTATPKFGQKQNEPQELKPADLDQLRSAMAATIEKAKQDDPKELRRIIRELERKVKTPQVSVDVDAIRYGYEKAASDNDIRVRRIVASVNESVSGLAALAEKICSQLSGLLSNSVPPRIEPVRRSVREPINHRSESPTNVSSNGSLPKGERIVLTAIAQHGTASREQLTVLTGYKRSSRDAYIQRLKERGYVESSGADVTATDIGVSALGSDYEPLPTGRELRDYWHNRLPEGERVFFDLLVDRYPNGLTRDELTDQSEYKRSSRDAYLQRLKAKKLVTTSGSMVTAAEHLF